MGKFVNNFNMFFVHKRDTNEENTFKFTKIFLKVYRLWGPRFACFFLLNSDFALMQPYLGFP